MTTRAPTPLPKNIKKLPPPPPPPKRKISEDITLKDIVNLIKRLNKMKNIGHIPLSKKEEENLARNQKIAKLMIFGLFILCIIVICYDCYFLN